MKKKGYLKIVGYLTGAVLCAVSAALLIAYFPDAWDGQVLNPVISLAKYALPAVGLLLLLEGAWSLSLALKGKGQRYLAATLMLRLQRYWDRRDRELHCRLQQKQGARQLRRERAADQADKG